MIPIISIIGWHNAGKTTFLERLLVELKKRGLRVATIKHTRGDFEIDHAGTDTWRFSKAGSDVVVISGKDRLALVENRQSEARLDEIVGRLPDGLDLVLTEGFKRAPVLKIEVVRLGGQGERIASGERLLAVISDTPLENEDAPQFGSSQAREVADLLESRGLIGKDEGRGKRQST